MSATGTIEVVVEDRSVELDDLHDARRRNRIAGLDWFDAFYKAYVGALLIGIGIYGITGVIGDGPVAPHTLATIREDGPAYAGLVVAVLMFAGLRSGGRGGPLAFERAEVRHVLLAPVDRRLSIGRPAMRTIRHAVFIGGATGAAAGLVALRRLAHLPIAWVVWGALFGAAAAVAAYGVALIAGGGRWPRWVTDPLACVLVVWSGVDVFAHLETSPLTWLGHVALWPMHLEPLGAVALVLVLALAVVGVIMAPGISIEAAERRSRLIGQLRFAATLQDVRTVMVLQRQLSQEHLRNRPWIRVKGARRALKNGQVRQSVFTRRALQDLARWPLFRIIRLFVFTAIASASVCGVWLGTTPLVVVAGLVLWIIGLDVLEPLAQEVDRPDRLRSMPRHDGWVMARHLTVPLVVMALLVGVGSIPIVIFGDPEVVGALSSLIVPIIFLSIGSAAVTIIRQPDRGASSSTPEVASALFLWRVVMPPGLAILGVAPIAVARNAWVHHHTTQAMFDAMNLVLALALALGSWALLWVRYGRQMQDTLGKMGARAVSDSKDVKK